MHIAGNVFVVTGAGNGIAREVTLQLLRKGARVAAVDLSEPALAETAALAGTTAARLTTPVSYTHLDVYKRQIQGTVSVA